MSVGQLDLRAPFPWFGGKSRVAPLVWERFGDVRNYVEPFAGSLAVLLGRPTEPGTETVNDRDCYLANFWRALQADPDALAAHADWPVNEADLHARHRWLVGQREFREQMLGDPAFYDVKIAGWWVWGLCAWIGSGWCATAETGGAEARQFPHLGDAGQGVNRRPPVKLPHLGNAGTGVNRRVSVQLPHLGDGGRGVHRARHDLAVYLGALSVRMRQVRVACGDWSRVMGDSVTWRHGVTGVLLDPPYSREEREGVYAIETDVAGIVRAWAVENGANPLLRIALCGYEGEHAMPDTWACVPWKAKGGYGSQGGGRGRDNAARERIWFSPACLEPADQMLDLFADPAA